MACGAPDDGEVVLCKYCQRPVSAEAQAHAIPCPKCRTACRWGKQKCGSCQTWIVVACVFCGGISPHNQQGCMACREPFAGAAERKQQRAQHQAHQQSMQTFGVVGNVAASFLGAAAGAVVGSQWGGGGGSYGHHSGWNSDSNDFVNNTNEDPPIGAWSDAGSTDYSGSTEYSGTTDYSDSGSSDFSGDSDFSSGSGDVVEDE